MKNGHITVKMLQQLRECPEKITYGTLGKPDIPSQKSAFRLSCFRLLKNTLLRQKSTKDLQESLTELFQREYKKGWFDFAQAYEQELKKDYGEMLRLGEHLLSLGISRCIADAPYLIELHTPAICCGTEFAAVSGTADLILFHQDGSREAICFCASKPKYSYAARNDGSRPEYSIELLALKMGFEQRYPGIKASLYYLKHKDDRGSSLEPYESRRGKNIISSDFNGMDTVTLFSRALSLHTERECGTCRYESTCHLPTLWEESGQASLETPRETRQQKPAAYTPAQREVIHHKDGPMNCIAVPGAGKTTCLVNRMLYLMDEGVAPEHILFVTFTQKAAREIRERVKKELKKKFGAYGNKNLPNIHTFNGLGYQILKENPVILGQRVKLASQIDRLRLIREILEKFPIQGVSYSGIYLPHGLIRSLERHFERIAASGEDNFRASYKGKDAEGILNAYRAYQEEFRKRELVTYDMQVSLCNQLLEDPELAEAYSRIFRYIMVDEFQDVSEDNARMVYTLAKCHGNLVVVGDDDQSIYSFRGGSNYHMLHFSENFPSAKTVMMEDNFRSDAGIAHAAASIIGKNRERFAKSILTHRDTGKLPIILPEFSAEQLPMLVEQLHHMGYGYGDIAILARYNKTLHRAKDILSPEIRCTNPKDYVINDAVFLAVADVLELFFYGMADMPLYRLLKAQGIELKKNLLIDRPIIECLCNIGINPVGELMGQVTADALAKATANIYTAIERAKKAKNMPELLRGIATGIFNLENHPVLSTLECLCDERAISSGQELLKLMQDMVLFSDQTRVKYEPHPQEVRLLTAHDSKGMEFPAVVLLSLDEFDDTEEERRLLYVAFTRAKETLVITKDRHSIAKLLPDLNGMVNQGGNR